MRKYLVCALLLSAPGCVSLTAAGERVMVVKNRSEVADCEAIGRVTGDSTGGLWWSYRNAKSDMRNKAGGAGANVVVLVHGESGIFGEAVAKGVAYKCPH